MRKIGKILVFTPTFNEKTNIGIWIDSVRDVNSGWDLLVVDDSSTDGTLQILQNYQSIDPRLKVHIRATKSGVGSAHAFAINHAYDLGYNYLIAMDADLSHDPKDIPRLITASQNANYVVGTRSKSRGGINELPGIRKVWSLGANFLCQFLIPTGVTEYTNSFRCYDRMAMHALIQKQPKSNGYSFFIEVTERVFLANLRLAEVPITFYNRKYENSKIPKMQVFLSAATIMRLIVGRLIRFL
jgi:dolichol-phosphate mannosyltransferase